MCKRVSVRPASFAEEKGTKRLERRLRLVRSLPLDTVCVVSVFREGSCAHVSLHSCCGHLNPQNGGLEENMPLTFHVSSSLCKEDQTYCISSLTGDGMDLLVTRLMPLPRRETDAAWTGIHSISAGRDSARRANLSGEQLGLHRQQAAL